MRKTAQLLFSTLAQLSFTKILKVARLALPNPLFAILSFYATVQSFVMAKKLFPDTSATNGIGNAFRHALWSCFIMMYCCKISSSQKALKWCRRMTDMHEELFPNKPLEKWMDLHNNQIGMNLFMEMLPGIHRQFFEKNFFVEALLKKIPKAKIITNVGEDISDELVYIAD